MYYLVTVNQPSKQMPATPGLSTSGVKLFIVEKTGSIRTGIQFKACSDKTPETQPDNHVSQCKGRLKVVVLVVQKTNNVTDFVVKPGYSEVVFAETNLGSQFCQTLDFSVFTGVNCRIMASRA